MKSAFCFFFLLLGLAGPGPGPAAHAAEPALAVAAAAPDDTVVVRLPNRAVMTLLVRDAEQLRQLPQYHLDSLVARLGGYIRQAEAAAKTSPNERVTLQFYPAKDQPGQGLPEQIRVTTRKPTNARRVEVLLNRIPGVHVDFDSDEPTANFSTTDAERKARQARRDSARRARPAIQNDNIIFRLDVGLNAFVNKSAYVPQPGLANPGTFELRPEGSRYVNLGFANAQRLGGKRSPVFASLGLEASFNNFMLRGNNKWVNENGRTEIVRETDGREFQKTKLVTKAVNVPLMLGVKLRNRAGDHTLTLAGGGFVGYLVNQHTKLKYFRNGETFKDKDYGSYNLNEWQYGLQGQLGWGGVQLFAKYHLNELFKENRGPQTQVLSFGVAIGGI